MRTSNLTKTEKKFETAITSDYKDVLSRSKRRQGESNVSRPGCFYNGGNCVWSRNFIYGFTLELHHIVTVAST
jgi:hypothetical protein